MLIIFVFHPYTYITRKMQKSCCLLLPYVIQPNIISNKINLNQSSSIYWKARHTFYVFFFCFILLLIMSLLLFINCQSYVAGHKNVTVIVSISRNHTYHIFWRKINIMERRKDNEIHVKTGYDYSSSIKLWL